MNFAELYTIVNEAKFHAPSEVRRIDCFGLYQMMSHLCVDVFGRENVQLMPNSARRYIMIRMGKRHFSFSLETTPRSIAVKRSEVRIPAISISFGWDEDPTEDETSTRDPEVDDGYPVMKTLQRETMVAIHKLRDSIFRKLAEYAVGIMFIAIGERRESLYSMILNGSGFIETRPGTGTFIPKALMDRT